MTENELSRRSFLKRMAVIGFAVPAVASFTLDALAATTPNQAAGNQFFPNQFKQTTPNQFFAGSAPNQFFPNQTFSNQYAPNQLFPNQFTG